jgi:chromosome segregation ATPase
VAGLKEIRKKISELEEAAAALRKERVVVEKSGCFSDKELAQKQERLDNLDQRLNLIEDEKDKLKTKLRLKPLRG